MSDLVFVVYDSIKNSAFAGQVLQPILKRINQNSKQRVYLISFEKEKLTQEEISQYIPDNNNLIFILLKRTPFFAKFGLYYSVIQLKKLFKNFTQEYSVICRGALAGWVGIKSIDSDLCISFTVQARGLLPEEYEYSKRETKNLFSSPVILSEARSAKSNGFLNYFLKNIFHRYIVKELTKIEKEVYKSNIKNFKIESVSQALKDHIIKKYEVNQENIILATYDIPEAISNNQLCEWKKDIRQKLNISPNTHVYCYNGSIKAWQSIELVINFFKQELYNNKNIFLLVLTQDQTEFENLLITNQINKDYYKVLYVEHSEIYKYLAACDTGLIFRENNIISWVSRPIKAMEYKSAGLKIVHNNTVKWLIDLK